MTHIPPHIEALRTNELLRKRLEFDWLEPDLRNDVRTFWLEIWSKIPYSEAFHRENLERLRRCVPLAQGPTRARRLDQTSNVLTLVWDPLDPEFVFVSLSHALPPLLWVKAPAGAQALLDVLAPYLAPHKSRVALSRSVRVVKTLDVPDRGVIERAIQNMELWLDDTTWANAFDDDPWLGVEGPLSMVQQTVWRRDVAEEHAGRFPSFSCRTLWSGSILRIEQHPFGMWVFDVRYDPASDFDVVARVNEVTPGHLPLDLPIDVAASLLRGANLDEVHVADSYATGRVMDAVAIQCALAPGETKSHAAVQAALETHHDDPDVMNFIVDVALAYQHEYLLFKIAERVDDTDLGKWLHTHLSPNGGR